MSKKKDWDGLLDPEAIAESITEENSHSDAVNIDIFCHHTLEISSVMFKMLIRFLNLDSLS